MPSTPSQPGGLEPPRIRPVDVEEIVETHVVTAERDESIGTIASKMAEEGVGSVVIVDQGTPVGIVTDRMIALALANTPDVAERTADEIGLTELVTGEVEMSVVDVLRRLEQAEIRRLPIVDDDGTLRGIVTLDDILLLLADELWNAADVIRSQASRR